MFSSRENRDNESLLSRDGESGGDKLWFVNPLIHSCRRNDGKERRVTIGVESAVRVPFVSIFHDNIKSFISIPKNCDVRVNVLHHPACGSFFFFPLSACSQVGWRGDKNGEQHYTDLSVGLVLRFFFAPFRERGRA